MTNNFWTSLHRADIEEYLTNNERVGKKCISAWFFNIQAFHQNVSFETSPSGPWKICAGVFKSLLCLETQWSLVGPFNE